MVTAAVQHGPYKVNAAMNSPANYSDFNYPAYPLSIIVMIAASLIVSPFLSSDKAY